MNLTPDKRPYRGSRRILWLAAGIVVAIAAYTGGWIYIGDQVEAQTALYIDRLNAQGKRADCERAEARGYPFRIGLFCVSARYEDASAGISFSAGALRSAAQIYNPSHIVGELDSPARLELPGLVPLELDWDLLRSSLRTADPLPRAVSVEGSNIEAKSVNDPSDPALFTAQQFEVHMRMRDQAVDLALSTKALDLSDTVIAGNHLPPFDAAADVTIDAGVKLALSGRRSLRGQSGVIRSARFDLAEGAGFDLSGTIQVDAEGLIDADLTLTAREPAKLSELLADGFPQIREAIDSNMAISAAIAASGRTVSLPLVVRGGKPVIGFIALEPIPPLP